MRRREFLAAAAGAAVFARAGRRVHGQSGAYSLVSGPNGRTLRTPDGRTVFEYMTQKPAETDMSANSVCCFAPLNSPGGERLTVFGQGHRHYRGVFFGWHTVEFREVIPPPAAPAGRWRPAWRRRRRRRRRTRRRSEWGSRRRRRRPAGWPATSTGGRRAAEPAHPQQCHGRRLLGLGPVCAAQRTADQEP